MRSALSSDSHHRHNPSSFKPLDFVNIKMRLFPHHYRSSTIFLLCWRPSVSLINQISHPRRSALEHCRHLSSTNNNGERDDTRIVLADETTHLPRLYVDAPSLSEKGLVTLTPFQSNYLNVMRISNTKRWGSWAGHCRIFNGKNGEWLSKIAIENSSNVSKKVRRRRQSNSDVDNTILECLQQTREQPAQKNPVVHLHMGRLKKQRRKWVLEKVTELGIASIDVVDTEFSSTTDIWEYDKHMTQVIEAAEQCERFTIPSLSVDTTPWSDLMNDMEREEESNDHWLICRERSPNLTLPIMSALQKIGNDCGSNIHILVGPEGGWSPMELEEMSKIETKSNIHFVSLGSLVLRAETAAIAAITATLLSQDKS